MTAGSIHDVGTLGHERIGLVQALALSRAFHTSRTSDALRNYGVTGQIITLSDI